MKSAPTSTACRSRSPRTCSAAPILRRRRATATPRAPPASPAGRAPEERRPGFGGPGGPRTGPGATLRYTAKGVGHPGYPGTADWTQALGRYWSHDYAHADRPGPGRGARLASDRARDLPGVDRPRTPAGSTRRSRPSNEYRTLTWLGIGNGWELRDLDGTVHTFDADRALALDRRTATATPRPAPTRARSSSRSPSPTAAGRTSATTGRPASSRRSTRWESTA